MDKVIIVSAQSPGKSIPLHLLLEEIAPVVIIDSNTGTHTETSIVTHHRNTFEIKNYREPDVEQHAIVKKENPYKNGMLRKKTKGGFKRF